MKPYTNVWAWIVQKGIRNDCFRLNKRIIALVRCGEINEKHPSFIRMTISPSINMSSQLEAKLRYSKWPSVQRNRRSAICSGSNMVAVSRSSFQRILNTCTTQLWLDVGQLSLCGLESFGQFRSNRAIKCNFALVPRLEQITSFYSPCVSVRRCSHLLQ